MADEEATAVPAEVLEARGAVFKVHEHPDRTELREVCAGLGIGVERTVKTLAFVTGDDRLVLAAVPGHARLRYGALARAAGVRRADLKPAGAERLAVLGMEPGGVCPVSADSSATVVFDESVAGAGHAMVFCGSGHRDSTIEIAASALVAAVPDARTAEIADLPGEDGR
ncbi:aminoacyl-tRNA deacylase [Streptomyces sp. NPDC048172]|uniref:aminoacyl-tRNA deacylase n=1 Tax=Streptomyces sp. NPDC048172 TaxID=3365505 RepID=UPI003712F236